VGNTDGGDPPKIVVRREAVGRARHAAEELPRPAVGLGRAHALRGPRRGCGLPRRSPHSRPRCATRL